MLPTRCASVYISINMFVLSEEMIGVPNDLGQSPPGVHISKRLLFSIVHEKSGENN